MTKEVPESSKKYDKELSTGLQSGCLFFIILNKGIQRKQHFLKSQVFLLTIVFFIQANQQVQSVLTTTNSHLGDNAIR